MACNNANILVFEKCDYLGAIRVQKWLSEPKMNMKTKANSCKKSAIPYIVFISYYFSILYRLGFMPFMRRKNLLKDGVSAKWSRSAIWVMLIGEVRSRKEASITIIWLM